MATYTSCTLAYAKLYGSRSVTNGITTSLRINLGRKSSLEEHHIKKSPPSECRIS